MTIPRFRRCFRFSLRTLFFVLKVGSGLAWFGPPCVVVHQRRSLMNKIMGEGGTVEFFQDRRPEVVRRFGRMTPVRLWLGDKAVYSIDLADNSALYPELAGIKDVFSESQSITGIGPGGLSLIKEFPPLPRTTE